MAKTPRTTRTPRAPRTTHHTPPARRSHAGRIMAAAIGVASATGLGLGLNHLDAAATPAAVSAHVQPDDSLTPGAVDATVHDAATICAHTWGAAPAGGVPIRGGGALTYSGAARHTSDAVKTKAYTEYGLVNPHDNGATYEVDHRLPLSLGGRDALQNLWPQSRTASGFNAWTKDRLEFRLYNLLCRPQPGDPSVTLAQAQQAFLGDWVKAYDLYCPDETACPSHGSEGD